MESQSHLDPDPDPDRSPLASLEAPLGNSPASGGESSKDLNSQIQAGDAAVFTLGLFLTASRKAESAYAGRLEGIIIQKLQDPVLRTFLNREESTASCTPAGVTLPERLHEQLEAARVISAEIDRVMKEIQL